MVLPELEQVIETRRKLGYPVFEGAFNLNITGIRSTTSKSNKFDDWMTCIYQDDKKNWKYYYAKCTTDPGKHWLLNPMNINGTIIMVPGHYPGAYKLGHHNKSKPSRMYRAFEQVKKMSYVRDNNKDNVLDFSLYRDPDLAKKHVFEGINATNLHRASAIKEAFGVGMYSAGCQVIWKPDDFSTLIDIGGRGEKRYGNSFSYTLVEEIQLLW